MLKNDKKENNIYNNVNTVNGLDTISGLDNVKKLNGIKDANNVYLATVIVVILAFNVILLTVSIFGNILSLFGLNGKSLHDECIEILNDPLIGMFLSQAIILIPSVVFLYNLAVNGKGKFILEGYCKGRLCSRCFLCGFLLY